MVTDPDKEVTSFSNRISAANQVTAVLAKMKQSTDHKLLKDFVSGKLSHESALSAQKILIGLAERVILWTRR